MKISVKLIQNKDEIIASCPELDINCYGADRQEAVRRIRDVIRFYIDAARELGLPIGTFDRITVDGEAETPIESDNSAQQTAETIH